MEKKLTGKRVAILVTDGFEESEFTKPQKTLQEAGAHVEVVSLENRKIRCWNNNNWGAEYNVDKTVDQVRSEDYDALILPGGVINPDRLRVNENAVAFVKGFFQENKPVAAICHGPWTLIETGELNGRMMTSYYSIKTDLENAGVNWVDRSVVVDNGLVTSRNPDDLSAFCKKMVEEIAEGVHQH